MDGKNYILIVHKPESSYIYRTIKKVYYGYFKIIYCTSEEELIKNIVQYRVFNSFLKYEEAEYELTIIKGDILILNETILNKINGQTEISIKRIEEKRKLEEKKERLKNLEKEEQGDRKEYERLKKKFDNLGGKY